MLSVFYYYSIHFLPEESIQISTKKIHIDIFSLCLKIPDEGRRFDYVDQSSKLKESMKISIPGFFLDSNIASTILAIFFLKQDY